MTIRVNMQQFEELLWTPGARAEDRDIRIEHVKVRNERMALERQEKELKRRAQSLREIKKETKAVQNRLLRQNGGNKMAALKQANRILRDIPA